LKQVSSVVCFSMVEKLKGFFWGDCDKFSLSELGVARFTARVV
jgi:hypothetical protein